MYSLRNLAVRFSLGTLVLATTVVACSDLPTTPTAPMQPSLSISTAIGNPHRKDRSHLQGHRRDSRRWAESSELARRHGDDQVG